MKISTKHKQSVIASIVMGVIIACAVSVYMIGHRKSENQLFVYSAHGAELFEPLIGLFKEQNPDVDVIVIVGKSGELLQRIRAETSNPVADVLLGGSRQTFESFSEYFHSYESGNDRYSIVQDPEHRWHAFSLFAQPIVVSTKRVAEKDYPVNTADLLDHKWKEFGGVVLASPAHSGTGISIVGGIAGELGWEFIERLLQNTRSTPGSNSMFIAVRDAEAAAGWLNEDLAVAWERQGARIKVIYPKDVLTAQIDAYAIVQDAPNLSNAKKFVDFLGGETAQELVARKLLRRPANINVAQPEELPAIEGLPIVFTQEPPGLIVARHAARLTGAQK